MGDGDQVRPLADGERVVVRRVVEFEAVVVRGEGDDLAITAADDTAIPELVAGEVLTIRTVVPGDAAYVARGRVLEVVEDGQVVVSSDGAAHRVQQRRFVRVRVDGLPVRVRGSDPDWREGELLDLSAGGLRACVGADDLVAGRRLEVAFELPSDGDRPLWLELPGEIAWVRAGTEGRPYLGVAFADVDEGTQQALTAWVYEQQRRRTRTRD